eukprot:gene14797-biopygen3618
MCRGGGTPRDALWFVIVKNPQASLPGVVPLPPPSAHGCWRTSRGGGPPITSPPHSAASSTKCPQPAAWRKAAGSMASGGGGTALWMIVFWKSTRRSRRSHKRFPLPPWPAPLPPAPRPLTTRWTLCAAVTACQSHRPSSPLIGRGDCGAAGGQSPERCPPHLLPPRRCDCRRVRGGRPQNAAAFTPKCSRH